MKQAASKRTPWLPVGSLNSPIWADAAVVVLVVFVLGTTLHELGHAGAAVASGVRVEEVNVLGVQIYPRIGWSPRPGLYGYCVFNPADLVALPRDRRYWVGLMGSATTWSASLLALVVFLRRGPPERRLLRTAQLALVGLCVDVVVHSLPPLYELLVVRPEHIYISRRGSELLWGVVSLGAPVELVLGLIFAYPAIAAPLIAWRWRHPRGRIAEVSRSVGSR